MVCCGIGCNYDFGVMAFSQRDDAENCNPNVQQLNDDGAGPDRFASTEKVQISC